MTIYEMLTNDSEAINLTTDEMFIDPERVTSVQDARREFIKCLEYEYNEYYCGIHDCCCSSEQEKALIMAQIKYVHDAYVSGNFKVIRDNNVVSLYVEFPDNLLPYYYFSK